MPACSTLGASAVKTEPVVEQFFVLRATSEEAQKLPLERQVGGGRWEPARCRHPACQGSTLQGTLASKAGQGAPVCPG